MSKVALTQAARTDLRQIQDHIAQDSTTTARRIVRELRDAMKRPADMPGKGRLREDLADEPLRVWVVNSFLIIYRPTTQPLQIVCVVSGHRDLTRLFE